MAGPYRLSAEAREWGEEWYKHWYANPPKQLQDDRFGGYLARKQTHLHKLAMIIAASCRDDLILIPDDLVLANTMITDLEADMPKVFARIGRSEDSIQAERLVQFVQKNSPVPYMTAYQYVHSAFPFIKDFEGIVAGARQAGLIKMNTQTMQLTAV